MSRSAKALPVVTAEELLKLKVPWLLPVEGSFFCAAIMLAPKMQRVPLCSVLVRSSR